LAGSVALGSAAATLLLRAAGVDSPHAAASRQKLTPRNRKAMDALKDATVNPQSIWQ
jgi:hypothetical protein